MFRPSRVMAYRPRADLGLVALVMVVLASSSTLAHDKSGGHPEYGSVRVGPVYLSMRAPFAAGVDSNVYNAPLGTSDREAKLMPTLQAVLPVTRRARIRGSGSIAPQYFHREASQRYTDLSGTVRGEVDVGPVTAFGGIGAGRYRERFTLEIDDRIERHEKNDTFGLALAVGKRVTVTASQLRVTSTFDPEAIIDGRPVSTRLDRRNLTRRLEISVPITRKTSVRPFTDFIEDHFLQPTPGLPSTVSSQRFGAALVFSELAFLNGTAAAGVRHFGSEEGVVPYDGPFLSVTLSSPFFVGTRLAVSASRDVAYSAYAAATESVRTTYVLSNYRAEVSFELPLSLHGRVFAGYAESRYLIPVGDEGGVSPQLDHGWLEGVVLLRHFGRHLSLGGRVQHENRMSPVVGRSYGGMAYGVAGEVRF